MNYKSNICFSKYDNGPLTAYSTQEEAKNGASYANKIYDNDLIPYECNKCKHWHLSPVSRNTQSIKCSKCTDRNGNNKDLYLTKEDAQQRADIIYAEQEIILDLYKCDHKNGWHLTKS